MTAKLLSPKLPPQLIEIIEAYQIPTKDRLTRIDLSQNKQITHLTISQNKLRNIDLNKCIHLNQLNLVGNQLSELHLESCQEFTTFDLSNNRLQVLSFRYSTQLSNDENISINHQKSRSCEIAIHCLSYINTQSRSNDQNSRFQKCNMLNQALSKKYRLGGRLNQNSCQYKFNLLKNK